VWRTKCPYWAPRPELKGYIPVLTFILFSSTVFLQFHWLHTKSSKYLSATAGVGSNRAWSFCGDGSECLVCTIPLSVLNLLLHLTVQRAVQLRMRREELTDIISQMDQRVTCNRYASMTWSSNHYDYIMTFIFTVSHELGDTKSVISVSWVDFSHSKLIFGVVLQLYRMVCILCAWLSGRKKW